LYFPEFLEKKGTTTNSSNTKLDGFVESPISPPLVGGD